MIGCEGATELGVQGHLGRTGMGVLHGVKGNATRTPPMTRGFGADGCLAVGPVGMAWCARSIGSPCRAMREAVGVERGKGKETGGA